MIFTSPNVWSFDRHSPNRIKEHLFAQFSSKLEMEPGFCEILNDDGIPEYAIANFDSGMGISVYMDPIKCVNYPYPFKITDVHLYLYDLLKADYLWPVNIQINIRGVAGGDKCDGPGPLLYSQTFSVPHDSVFPKMMNLSLSPPYCVLQPFFLEVMYQSRKDTLMLPSLLLDDSVATQDSCNNWFLDSQGYHRWIDYWDETPPGDAIIRASGYINDFDCHNCGDANGDGIIDVGDVVYLINYLYKHGPAPNPLQVGDVNLDGVVNIGDVVYLLNYLFKNGPPPCES